VLREEILFFDGAMGTMLQQAGLAMGELPEIWNLDRPDVIRRIHERYFAAGSRIVTANTFGAHAPKLGERLAPAVQAGVSIAREAANAAGEGHFVALDIGPCGKLLEPLGTTSFEEAYEIFAQTVRAGTADGLCDLVLIETMGDLYEMKAAVLSVKENCDLPVFCTMTFDENRKTLTGADISAAVALLEGLGADCIGINCGLGPRQAQGIVEELCTLASVPILVQPNAGMPVFRDGKTVYDVTPEEFAACLASFARRGVRALGGCCGTTPAHIAAAVDACRGIAPVPVSEKGRTVVSSYARGVVIGERPVVIGERINPTGKKKLRQALLENDLSLPLREAAAQQDCGADLLDVNVGVPGLDERTLLPRIVRELQSVTDLPLQIDSADADALGAAMRIYNGCPMVNSVNGKRETMEAVFPLVKKYGGAVVGLCLDENGIPDTPEGRLRVARRIVETAQEYGIARKNIVIDALTLTVSADQREAFRTLDALSLIKRELGVKTILGVSNVSFGLPRRDAVNATFLTLALRAGLDACIINPCAEQLMSAWRTYRVLSGSDENAVEYISACAGERQPEAVLAQSSDLTSLYEIVVRGMRELAVDAAKRALAEKSPLEVVETILIPALDAVGQGYESGKLFLPQLIMSAETVQKAFGVIKEHLTAQDGEASHGRVILATVKGDIHDIGKNIVKVLLENYGFTVLDLGRDVPIETIVETAKRERIRMVGLSALMTTTVESMRQTIQALHEAGLTGCCIVAGGAVLTREYAARIGADFYAGDAMETVRIAKRLFEEGTL